MSKAKRLQYIEVFFYTILLRSTKRYFHSSTKNARSSNFYKNICISLTNDLSLTKQFINKAMGRNLKFKEDTVVIGTRVPKSKKQHFKQQFNKIIDDYLLLNGEKQFDFEIFYKTQLIQVAGIYNENQDIEIMSILDNSETSIYGKLHKELDEIKVIVRKELFD